MRGGQSKAVELIVRDAAEQIAREVQDLKEVAAAAGLPFLSYLLAMAADEATLVAQDDRQSAMVRLKVLLQ